MTAKENEKKKDNMNEEITDRFIIVLHYITNGVYKYRRAMLYKALIHEISNMWKEIPLL